MNYTKMYNELENRFEYIITHNNRSFCMYIPSSISDLNPVLNNTITQFLKKITKLINEDKNE